VLQRVEDLDAADRAAPDPTPDPAPEPTPDQIAALLESDVPQLGQADQVTADDIANLRRQIEACWNVPAGARDAGDLIVRLRVVMKP
jgi:DNA-binding transcriptional regulator PaaX